MNVSFLAPLYAVDGPYASVFLDTTRSVENAPHEIELRWRGLRARLEEAGADEKVLGALDGAVGRDIGTPGPHGQALIAADGRVLLDRHLPAPPMRDAASWLPVPDPLPLLAALENAVPYVLAVVDRVGADIHAYGPHGSPVEDEQVEGGTFDIRKVKPGDWAHKQYQRRAENLWSENAERVAEEVGAIVHRLHAELLVVTGDSRAREKLRLHLDRMSADRMVVVDAGGRGPGASEEKLQREVHQLVLDAAARRRRRALDDLERERGEMDRAAEGVPAVVQALRRAQVHTLYLPEDGRLATGALWIGPEATHLGLERGELEALGVSDPRQAPAAPALVRAMCATEDPAGGVVLVPGEEASSFTDGVACLLRWTDAATPRAQAQ